MPARPLRVVPDVAPGAVLYIRQSVTRYKRDADGNRTPELDTVSPELQETAGRDYCARMGYKVTAVVTDLNRSGRTLVRRSVQEAIGHIEGHQAEVIVVWKWSRLSRNRRDFAVTCDHIESLGGRVESSTEPTDTTTASGRLTRGMLAELAAFESDRQGEIFKSVHDGRVRQGLPGNGKARFGYRNVDKRFMVDPDTGPALAQMYRMYLGGSGYYAIATWLNDHGYRTANYDGLWRHGVVRWVLDSGFGAGLITHRGEKLPGVHEPVINKREWERYLALRAERTWTPSRTKGSRYILSGLIKCGRCGKAMHAKPDMRPDHHLRVWYVCVDRPNGACGNGYAAVDRVEAAVKDWLTDLVADVDKAAEIAHRERTKLVTHRHKAKSLARQVADVDAALTRLMVDNARRPMPESAYDAAREELLATRARLVEHLDDAERVTQLGARFDVPAYRGLLREWDTVPVDARREALRAIIARVRVWFRRGEGLRVEVVPRWAPDDNADNGPGSGG